MDELHKGTENRKITQVMTLDQTAAFDCVSHTILLGKLRRYKVGPAAARVDARLSNGTDRICDDRDREI